MRRQALARLKRSVLYRGFDNAHQRAVTRAFQIGLGREPFDHDNTIHCFTSIDKPFGLVDMMLL